MTDQQTKRILLVDDDELSREVLALLLEAEGYEVTAAESGQAAIDLVETQAGAAVVALPDVILTDMQMPGICGEELRARLAEICGTTRRDSGTAALASGTAILAMSGTRPSDAALKNFDGFLLKPFTMEELHRAIDGLQAAKQETEAEGLHVTAAIHSDVVILDERTFVELSQRMQKQQVSELYGMCLRDSVSHVLGMDVCARESDEEGYRRHAHAMKGSLGMVGARELQAMAAEAETYNLRSMLQGPVTKDNLLSGMKRLRSMLLARGIEIAAPE